MSKCLFVYSGIESRVCYWNAFIYRAIDGCTKRPISSVLLVTILDSKAGGVWRRPKAKVESIDQENPEWGGGSINVAMLLVNAIF